MVSEEIKLIIEGIKAKGKMCFLDATSCEKITSFEKKNSIELPQKYKEWLQYSDGGELFLPAGIQLYGIEHKPIIDVNDNSRPSDDYIVIGTFASGDSILCKKGDDTISIYNQETGEIDDELVFEDFVQFLKEVYELLGLGE